MKLLRRYFWILPVILVLGLGLDIVRTDQHESCMTCDARASSIEWSLFFMGCHQQSHSTRKVKPSKFAEDFPEFSCSHLWSFESAKNLYLWNSPVVVQTSRKSSSVCSRSSVAKYYNASHSFREAVRGMIDGGLLSGKRLVELAECHCMDGGRCLLVASDDNGDRLLLKLLDAESHRMTARAIKK